MAQKYNNDKFTVNITSYGSIMIHEQQFVQLLTMKYIYIARKLEKLSSEVQAHACKYIYIYVKCAVVFSKVHFLVPVGMVEGLTALA